MITNPKFYMQEIAKPDTKPIKDLEVDFSGMKYLSCKGLSSKGKSRVYTEQYADSNGIRVYIPTTYTVDIEFEFVFAGDNRRDVFDTFYEYVKNKKLRYWDNVRNRQVEMYLSDKVEPSEDILLGSTPYIKATFKFTNINGISTKKS